MTSFIDPVPNTVALPLLALTEAHFINVHNINEGYTTCAALTFGAETSVRPAALQRSASASRRSRGRIARRGTPSSSSALAAPAPIPQQCLAHAFVL
ncbi:hypothetical protein DFH09DRAFT_1368822 [Mycena vulgaris]|nr:hypothetical protein DFH09DRAFT_1368822 [Mycena vulgaris]